VETTYTYIKQEWKALWAEKIEDRWIAEDIADREYAVLFVDQGDIIWATRDFKPLQFYDILERHEKTTGKRIRPIDPRTGGWGKFVREEVRKSTQSKKAELGRESTKLRSQGQGPIKKGGRGWLHGQ